VTMCDIGYWSELSVGVMSVTSERERQAEYGESMRSFQGKIVPVNTMTADGDGGGLDPLILNLDTR
jgi:hypothetical protein